MKVKPTVMIAGAAMTPIAAFLGITRPLNSTMNIVSACIGVLSLSIILASMMNMILTLYRYGFSIKIVEDRNEKKEVYDGPDRRAMPRNNKTRNPG